MTSRLLKFLILYVFGGLAILPALQAAISFKEIYSFQFGPGQPFCELIQHTNGEFYGTASVAGPDNNGAVFKINSYGAYTTLYTFPGDTNGINPSGGLVRNIDGNFYGVTSAGNTNAGIV